MSTQDFIQKEQGFVIDFVAFLFDDVIQYLLFTPYNLFTNIATESILIKMILFSGGLTTIFTMIEAFKRMLSVSYTPFSRIIARYPIALAVSAFAPTLFYYGGKASNELVDLMGLLTSSSLEGKDHFVSMTQGVAEHVQETITLFFMLIIMAVYVFRILLYHASRWFGLLFNLVTTPIAMTGYIFKPYENVASEWFKDTMHKLFVVVAHSLMLGLITIILFAPTYDYVSGFMNSFSHSLTKIILAIGGLQMMMNPPNWISRFFDKGDNALQMISRLGVIKKVVGGMNFTLPKGGK